MTYLEDQMENLHQLENLERIHLYEEQVSL
jgi:hypothetical protein